MTALLLAYHNDPKIKEEAVAEITAHRDADRLMQNYGYWTEGKGCAVGCLLKSGNHIEYEKRFGIPVALARLEDRIFEGLPMLEAQEWPVRFMSAPKVGADLSSVNWKFLHWMLLEIAANTGAKYPEIQGLLLKTAYLVEQKTHKDVGNIDPTEADSLLYAIVAQAGKIYYKSSFSGPRTAVWTAQAAAQAATWYTKSSIKTATWSAEAVRVATLLNEGPSYTHISNKLIEIIEEVPGK